MDNWFKSKWFIRILSLAFAVTLYAFVSVSEDPGSDATFSTAPTQTETLDRVPVEIRMDREKYVVNGVPDPDEGVKVSLKGTSGSVTPLLLQRNFDVYVDLEGLEEGTHTVELQHTISDDVEVFIEPKTIDVTIEERASQEFEVQADFINTDSFKEAGLEVVSHNVEPQTVTITSSRSNIESIGAVKVYVNLEEVTESINNREVPVNVYDLQGNEMVVSLDPETVQVSVEVDNPSKTVPLSVQTEGELPENYEVDSITANEEEVEIYSQNEVLEDISEVNTEPVDLSDIEESSTMEVPLDLPENVQAPDTESVEVTVEVDVANTIEGVSLEEAGLGDGFEVSYADSNTIDVEVTGDPSVVNKLTADDIQAVIDLSDLEPGEHRVPITIEVPEADDVTATSSVEEVTVEITGPTEEE